MNLFDDVPHHLPEEQLTTLLETPGIRIERIVSHGQTSQEGFWYDQERPEFVVLLTGRARVAFEDREVELVPGSYLHIPAHRRHRVAWTDPSQPCVWLAIHHAR